MRTTLPPIAVIRAGFSGSMAALHLGRLLPERPVLPCEKSSAFARGLAYATGCSDHLLNVRAANMSAFPDQPEHFFRWLEGCPLYGAAWTRSTPAGLFAARGLYGRYLTDLLLTTLSKPRPGPLLMLENDEAVDLAPTENGFDLTLAAGRRRGPRLRQPAGAARSAQPLRGRSMGRYSARRPAARPAVAHRRDRTDHGRCRCGPALAALRGSDHRRVTPRLAAAGPCCDGPVACVGDPDRIAAIASRAAAVPARGDEPCGVSRNRLAQRDRCVAGRQHRLVARLAARRAAPFPASSARLLGRASPPDGTARGQDRRS